MTKTKNIKEAVSEVINNNKYKENAEKLAKIFRDSGESTKVVNAILKIIEMQ